MAISHAKTRPVFALHLFTLVRREAANSSYCVRMRKSAAIHHREWSKECAMQLDPTCTLRNKNDFDNNRPMVSRKLTPFASRFFHLLQRCCPCVLMLGSRLRTARGSCVVSARPRIRRQTHRNPMPCSCACSHVDASRTLVAHCAVRLHPARRPEAQKQRMDEQSQKGVPGPKK